MISKKILCITGILLAALAIFFVILAVYNASDEVRGWYEAEYLKAQSAIFGAEKEMEKLEETWDEFKRNTGVSYQEVSPTEYRDYLDLHERTLRTLKNTSDTCWNKLQEFKTRTTVFGILSAVCAVGSIVTIYFSKKKGMSRNF